MLLLPPAAEVNTNPSFFIARDGIIDAYGTHGANDLSLSLSLQAGYSAQIATGGGLGSAVSTVAAASIATDTLITTLLSFTQVCGIGASHRFLLERCIISGKLVVGVCSADE